ncbi:hypothetical protein RRL34_004253 [Vibrio parahaemolyticus]|nr:hypothetical protein [Vibrio parahaemolyticus]
MTISNNFRGTVYVLKLECDHFFVGITTESVEEKFKQFKQRKGLSCLRAYRALEIVKVYEDKDAEFRDKVVERLREKNVSVLNGIYFKKDSTIKYNNTNKAKANKEVSIKSSVVTAFDDNNRKLSNFYKFCSEYRHD